MDIPKLKNYTTSVSAKRSINSIDEKLVAFGALSIHKNYNNGEIRAICFVLHGDGGNELSFKFEITDEDVLRIANHINSDYKTKAGKKSTKAELEHARNVAWKILSDAVHAQLSLVHIRMFKNEQVFLPFLYDAKNNVTYFEFVQQNGIKGLLPANQEEA